MSQATRQQSPSPSSPSGSRRESDEEAVERLQASLKREVERVLRYNFHDVCVANNEEMLEDLIGVVHFARSAWDEYCVEEPLPRSGLDPEQRQLIQRFEAKQEKLNELTNELIESKRTLNASRDAYRTEREYLEELHWSMGLGKLRAPKTVEVTEEEFTSQDQEAYNRAVVAAMESGLKAKHKTELAALRLANVAEQRGLQQRLEKTKQSKEQAMHEHAVKISKMVQKLEKLGAPLSSADRGELATAYRYLNTQHEAKHKEPSKAIAPGAKDRPTAQKNQSRMSVVTKRMSTFENAPRSSLLATMAGLPQHGAESTNVASPKAADADSKSKVPPLMAHSGTAFNTAKDFKPSRDPLQALGSLSSSTSRQENSLSFPSHVVARDLYATPRRKPKPTTGGADIPRVGCPPRRRVAADAARRSLNESLGMRSSLSQTGGSVGPSALSPKGPSMQSMKFPPEPPMSEEPPGEEQEEPDSPHWVTQPKGLLRLGPSSNPSYPGYCLRPVRTGSPTPPSTDW